MNIGGFPEAALRLVGGAFNVALALAFAWLAASFYGTGIAWLEAAGGLASPAMLRAAATEPAVALGWISGFVTGPDPLGRIASYAVAWMALIAAAGCAWMAVLGFRWAYHAVLRALMAR